MMYQTVKTTFAAGLLVFAATSPSLASEGHGSHKSPHPKGGHTIAKNHAPIGVMGDHLHKKGEVMMSLRYMRMDMGGNRIGTNSVSPETIATTVPNIFAGAPGMPPTLRVVPTDMTMDMYMVGAMYGLTNSITLMAMGQIVEKEMDHTTFAGGMGTNVLGEFTTKSNGFGDTKVAALVRLFNNDSTLQHEAHLNLGLNLPTGSIGESDQILTPMGMTPSPRLPYPMQLGSGTFDLEPGITYNGYSDQFSWGAQYRATIRTGNSDGGYTLGDIHNATAWAQYGPATWVSFSLRGQFRAQSAIDGRDALIMAPVQTANPNFHGGERLEIGPGINFAGQSGAINGHRIAIEALIPVYQDLNGPQMETNWTLTVGWQKMF